MEIKNVTVAGGGVLGSQIAFQSAYSGFNVTIWELNESAKEEALKKLKALKKSYNKQIRLMDKDKSLNSWAMGISDYDSFNKDELLEKVGHVLDNIKITLDKKEAFSEADLVIESIIENLNIKREFYSDIAKYLGKNTILVSNSSTIIPSKMAKYTGRSEKFLSLHFANHIWKNNTAEVMKHSMTSDKAFDLVMKFAKDIRMFPLPVYKEKSGYLLNSMLIPFLFAGLDLYVNGISDVKSIDIAWKKGTGAPRGPFEILDIVGLKTAYNIVLMYVKIPSFLVPYNFKGMKKLLEKYIAKGKLGVSSGEGFYKYEEEDEE